MPRPAGKSSRAPARSSARTRKPAKKPLMTEVKYLGLAAVGILLLLSVFIEGAAGFVGRFINQISLSLLGFGAYILPFAVIGAAVYALFSRERTVPRAAVIKAALFSWFLIAFIHITSVKSTGSHENVWVYLQFIYTSGSINNGGLLGALLGNLLRDMLGPIGANMVLIVGGLIVLMLLTGKSFTNILAFLTGNIRTYFEDMREEKEWDEDYEEEEYEEDEEDHKPLPPRRKPLKKQKPELLVIDEKKASEPRKILLLNEDFNIPNPPQRPNPIFASRRREAPYKTEPIAEPKPEPIPLLNEPPWDEKIYQDEAYIKGAYIEEAPLMEERPFFEEPEPFFEEVKPVPKPSKAPTEFTIKGLNGPGKAEPLFDDEEEEEVSYSESRPALILPFEEYQYPTPHLLSENPNAEMSSDSETQIYENSRILEDTLKSFKIEAKVIEVSVGPTVTRYDMAPGPGVKVATIANLSNDLALSLAAQGIRIEAPVPGKSAVGIEIPNKDPQPVFLREILEDDTFTKFPSRLAFAVGKDIAGSPVVTDIGRMPHLLIAGATGSGKSVCINTLIASLLYKSRPDEVKLLMIDPKVVELSVYNGIPHLLIPVVTDPKKASGALSWAVNEMENRYMMFAEAGTRDLKGYNTYLEETEAEQPPLPQIVIIIDELADLMMVAKGEVEESICRLAQKARACGIHLIVATQRPSVDVITGLIKANIPSRLAFAVSSGTDSRTVLDMYGAEKLLGKGDMLFLPMGKSKPIRLQGGFISDKEVEGLVKFLKVQTPEQPTTEMIETITAPSGTIGKDSEMDEFFHESVNFLLEKGKASTSMLQRQFRIGYNRASRLMEELENRGIVGPEDGVKPRKILITREEYITML